MASRSSFLTLASSIGSRVCVLKKPAAVILVLTGLALGGCGGDDEPDQGTGTATTPAATETGESGETTPESEAETGTEERTETEPSGGGDKDETAPEDTEGGAGDEEPARVPAMFTGRGGEITPRLVRVPAFIAIRVELTSADGREYGLRFGGESVTVSGDLASVSTTLDGLRPGQTVVGIPTGGGRRVRIEASAEPGP